VVSSAERNAVNGSKSTPLPSSYSNGTAIAATSAAGNCRSSVVGTRAR
jgi:hypothetical protein